MTERQPAALVPVLALIVALVPGCGSQGAEGRATAETTITVDPSQRFQTMVGWEATAQAGQDEPGFSAWSDALFDLAVGDLGINRLRLGVNSGMESRADVADSRDDVDRDARCRRYLTVNDNDDPFSIDWPGFALQRLDDRVERVVLPIKRRLEARGEKLYLNLEYVAFIAQCDADFDYVHARPDEYAEFILAIFLHLREKFRLVPDGLEIILEPDNVPGWSGERIGLAMVATAQRLAAAGFRPEFIAPSTTSMAAAARYVDAIVAVPGARKLLSEISYHRYRGVSSSALREIAARAEQLGVRTAMLEHVGAGVEELYDDLLVGGASAWQQYTLAFAAKETGAQYYRIVDGQPVLASRTRYLRHYFRYVRAGAVRIGATSDSPRVRALAFENPGGRTALVLHVDRPTELVVRGLPAGAYDSSLTSEQELGTNAGSWTVAPADPLRLTVASAAVVTLFRK